MASRQSWGQDMDGSDAPTRRRLFRLYQRLAREGVALSDVLPEVVPEALCERDAEGHGEPLREALPQPLP